MAEKESSRERILSLLEQNRGVFVSGEQIAEQLNISRNSVWKAVRALRKEGYKIAAVTNRGYNLTEDNDKLSVQGIRQYLQIPENACRIQVYKELPSTNLTAKELTAHEDQAGCEQVLVKKYKAMACLCSDTKLQGDLNVMADKHQQHYNTLMTFLQ